MNRKHIYMLQHDDSGTTGVVLTVNCDVAGRHGMNAVGDSRKYRSPRGGGCSVYISIYRLKHSREQKQYVNHHYANTYI